MGCGARWRLALAGGLVGVAVMSLPAPALARRSTPSVVTGSAQGVSQTSATLTGTVDPNGAATSYWFQYGTSTSYGAQTPTAGAGAGTSAVAVSASVAGLSAATTYHFRLVAKNSAGTQSGADHTFTTAGYYANPVFSAAESPDPFVLDNGATHDDYYEFNTGDLFPVLHSTDLIHWSTAATAMTSRPSWVVASGDWHPWAPSVVRVNEACPSTSSSTCYVMYYVGLSAQTSANCVGVATATDPGGPYADQGPLTGPTTDAIGRPVGCGDNAGYGVIDPSPFVDPATSQAYLYASEDFACPVASTSCTSTNSTLQPTISVIPLSADMLHAAGARTPLFSGATGTWEAAGVSVPTVEGPTAMVDNGTYYLLYSGGNWQGAYGMGYATAASPTGPFTKSPRNPILAGTPSVLSPGGADTPVIGPHGATWLVYHGRSSSLSAPRTLRIDPFSWSPGTPAVPVISGPTSTPQPTLP